MRSATVRLAAIARRTRSRAANRSFRSSTMYVLYYRPQNVCSVEQFGCKYRIQSQMQRKLYLETFGCQMNVLDSELVLGQLRAQGYESTEDRDAADVILFNTCSVREHAEQKVWSRLGELRPRKAAEPHVVIGVIGCMAERDGVNLLQRYPHVDILCGPGELDKLTGLVHNAVVTNAPGHKRQRQVALMGAAVRRSSTLE